MSNWISIILGKQKVSAVKVSVGMIKDVCNRVKPWEHPGGNMKPCHPMVIITNVKELCIVKESIKTVLSYICWETTELTTKLTEANPQHQETNKYSRVFKVSCKAQKGRNIASTANS